MPYRIGSHVWRERLAAFARITQCQTRHQLRPIRAYQCLGLSLIAIFFVGCGNDKESKESTRPTSTHDQRQDSAGPLRELPDPNRIGKTSLEDILASRRSHREFSPTELTDAEVGQLLWAAQGTTSEDGKRTSPSAGALYPLEVYVARSDGLDHYDPKTHGLRRVSDSDLRRRIYEVALRQSPLKEAPAIFVITAVYARTEKKYGPDSQRYVHMEAGHAAQNLLLQTVALDLGAVPIGAFEDDDLRSALGLGPDETPLYVIPVGHPR